MPALKPIRRAQLISPFGVGAMVDFPGDESLITAGLDAWPFASDPCPADWFVTEERLQARLGVSHFRLPPEYREPGHGVLYANQAIPFLRFPLWHYCPRRGAMERLPVVGGGRHRCPCRPGLDCATLTEKRKPFLIPVRIVTICKRGHLADFPFPDWVHRRGRGSGDHRLRFMAGRSSASLAGIRIECACGQVESLAGAFDFDPESGGRLRQLLRYDCPENRPWFADVDGQAGRCGEPLRVVQRGATNVYFPVVRSSIYLPLWGEQTARDVVSALERPEVWRTLTDGLDEGKYIQASRCEIVANLYRLNAQELRVAAQRKLDGERLGVGMAGLGEEEYRRQEYEALKAQRGGANTDLLVDRRAITEYPAPISLWFSSVYLVRKLRETRALAGFTRLLPPDDDETRVQRLRTGAAISWLPAIVVRGEGVFLEIDSARLEAWLSRSQVLARAAGLNDSYNARRKQRGQPARAITAKFLLLHTFAHALIAQLSFDCGYGSSALRERIYCDIEDPSRPMQGILIYTASGDSEGTLGGLVRQGEPRRFYLTVLRALKRAEWCSADPVCIESSGQGAESSNLAACHGCSLLPETSCEEGNRLLDRGMLLGVPKESRLRFFEA